ncbi:hypothetical protein KAR91_30470 [Candidatus Pacearchaeota archaeon]|nr:hypothetical protein [Candidatus Pacearchaeota archaeon]
MIIGVALRNENVIIMLPKPNRHSDCFLHADKLGIDTVKARIGTDVDHQGFYTHTGKYLNRRQALKYVRRIKQTTIGNPIFILCSEDLW